MAAVATSPDDYHFVYGKILSQLDQPAILHWLGEMFDPALAGYWGSPNHREAMETLLAIIEQHQDKIDGVKISLLNQDLEIEMRRRLPASVKMYTGDDFNFADLIAGDEHGHSHALLGIFAAIAPLAATALTHLANGNHELYHQILAPTVPLSRHIFSAPTRYYKTGVVFMAWLNGHQDHFTMVGGQQANRSILHLCEIFKLASEAGALTDLYLATKRMKYLLAQFGI